MEAGDYPAAVELLLNLQHLVESLHLVRLVPLHRLPTRLTGARDKLTALLHSDFIALLHFRDLEAAIETVFW